MKVVAIIPARYASKRLPGKALLDIGGQAMVVRVWQRAMQAELVDRVIVATDDQRIMDAVAEVGGEAVMTRAEHTCGTDRVAEVASKLEAEIVINVQGDEALVSPRALDLLAEKMLADDRLSMATLATELEGQDEADPNVVKVVLDLNGSALYFSRSMLPYARRKTAIKPLRHLGIYGFRRDFLLDMAKLAPSPLELAEGLEQLRVLEHGHKIFVLQGDFAEHGVDTEEQLARTRRHWEKIDEQD